VPRGVAATAPTSSPLKTTGASPSAYATATRAHRGAAVARRERCLAAQPVHLALERARRERRLGVDSVLVHPQAGVLEEARRAERLVRLADARARGGLEIVSGHVGERGPLRCGGDGQARQEPLDLVGLAAILGDEEDFSHRCRRGS